MDNSFKRAPHNPPHWFQANTIYMLTASIYHVAWVVLDNHYHAMVESLDDAFSLSKFTGSYHKYLARKWNDEENTPGRKVWWNYWDTCIRSEKDFINRLQYIFWNPVKHGLVDSPEDYPFSSYKDYLEQKDGFDFTGLEEVNDVPEF